MRGTRALAALVATLTVVFVTAGRLGAQEQTTVQVTGSTAPRLLSVEEAVRLALSNNLHLLATSDSVSSAEISEELAESRFGLKVTPSFARGFGSDAQIDQRYGVDLSKLLPTGTSVSAAIRSDVANGDLGDFTNTRWDVTVSQPLLRGFGRRATELELHNARRGRESAGRNYEIARQRLAVDVVAAYYNIIRQQGLVDVAEGAVERTKELLRASEARLKVGLASKLDVFRAELQLSQSEDALISRTEALELALDQLKFQLGLGPEEEVALEMVEPEYQTVSLDIDELTRQALAHRIEVREERDRINDSRRSLAVARQSLLPDLDLNLQYAQQGLGSSFAESFDLLDRGVNVFFSTSYSLDRSAETAALALSQIDMESRRRSLRLTQYNIANEVRAAARYLERIDKSLRLQEKNIEFAEKQFRLATLRYQRGLASNFDIIDAENNVVQAHSNYVSLLADHHVALIELKRVTGTLDLEREFAPGSFLPAAHHHP